MINLMVHVVTARVHRGIYILPNVVLCFREVTDYNLGSETIAFLTEVFRIFPLSLHTNPRIELCYATSAFSLYHLLIAVPCLPTI